MLEKEIKVINREEGDVLVGLYYVVVFYLVLLAVCVIGAGVVWLVR